MTLIDNYNAALFTVAPAYGDINPPFEARFKGYKRIQFCTLNGRSLDEIEFPVIPTNYKNQIKFLCTLNFQGKVIDITKIECK